MNYQTAISPKPYDLVPLAAQPPQRQRPIGQEAYKRLSGTLKLHMSVKTAAFIASGVVAMGKDISNQHKNIPLIKVGVGQGNEYRIPGSSLKGAIRSTYEAMTSSCLCKTRARREQIPNGYSECRDAKKLCPACQVFGAMGWQGLISFQDAVATSTQTSVGFMPSLYAPRPQRKAYYKNGKVAGRKFYYHTIKAVNKGQQQGIPVQQAGTDWEFTTQIRFLNLTEAELGTLLTVLGQDEQHSIALKIGGGKPIGMGTLTVEVLEMDCPKNVRDRYLTYESPSTPLKGKELRDSMNDMIRAAHSQLIQKQQLQALQEILGYPTQRKPPEGVY